jgi:ABC-type polysaccharide/polyol phosphate export permease
MTAVAGAAARSRMDHYDSVANVAPEFTALQDLWAYRNLVWELIVRDIKVRYKRSVLGIAWTMLSPLLNMAALAVVFSAIMQQQAITNYPVFFLTGLIYWTFFATGTSYAATQSQDANDIAKRTFVPRSVFVVSSVGVALVNLVLSFVPLLLILVLTGFPLHATWWFVPVALALLIAFTAGVGFLIFTIASRFSDVREMYLVLINTWFFITPIAYVTSLVPAKYRIALWVNPHYYLIQVFRDPIYKGTLPPMSVLLFSAALAVGALLLGWTYFCRNVDEFAFKS